MMAGKTTARTTGTTETTSYARLAVPSQLAKDCTSDPMPKIERHVFVCTNARPIGGKPSCGARGAAEVLTALQEGLGEHPELGARSR